MTHVRAVGGGEPRPAALQAALIKVTEALARELVHPNPAPPDWSDFEWTVAQAVAAMHGVSPLLSGVSRWPGPRRWGRFLQEQRAHVADRHTRIERLLNRIDQRARAEGVAIVALKGAALHAIGLYEEGERPMADVDLLVRPQDVRRASRLIESLEYYEYRASWRERAFAPSDGHPAGELGEHSCNNITIELHDRICERLPLNTTDITAIVFPSRPQAGLNRYPSRAALMLHLLLHAAGSMALQTLRLLQLHDLALLALRMTAADWDELIQWRSGERGPWWALPPLRMVSRYYPIGVPERILGRLKLDCPWLLHQAAQRRSLSDVSLSHLWVDAFPGIEWSQSVREMLRYARSRVRPDAEHLALRSTTTHTQPWAASSQWSSLSQTRRILRWVVRRQTRPATMHVVRAALVQAR
jgi:Uncharacterised nucleotidyltransferase